MLHITCAGKHLTNRGSHTIAFRIDESPDLSEVAVSLSHILNAGGLHQQRIVRREHTLDSFIIVLHQRCLLPAAHECPHLLICRYFGFLRRKNEDTESHQSTQITPVNISSTLIGLILWIVVNDVNSISRTKEWFSFLQPFTLTVLYASSASFAVPGTLLLAQL